MPDRDLKTEIVIPTLQPDFSPVFLHICKYPTIHPVTEDKDVGVILESSLSLIPPFNKHINKSCQFYF